ncbi:MAG: hypothetical protein U9N61_01705 [Euryarchaeota archaeon]|nr:hypothetical protein [Euryarchaeota archaeon]
MAVDVEKFFSDLKELMDYTEKALDNESAINKMMEDTHESLAFIADAIRGAKNEESEESEESEEEIEDGEEISVEIERVNGGAL